MVEVVAADVQALDAEAGEVGVGLPHNGDDVHLPLLGDVLVLVPLQHGSALPPAVAFGRRLHKVADAVEKGVEKAAGYVVLGGVPVGDALVVFDRVVELLVQIDR